MKQNRITKNQSGYALILTLLGLLTLAGLTATSFIEEARREAVEARFSHNQNVLKQAKRALLQYAYDYPEFKGRGPGRLPCPDSNYGDDLEGKPNSSFYCIKSGVEMVGRFPWGDDRMHFNEVRDASGGRLWYAVSSQFANSGPSVINSDTKGTITIEDRTGTVLYHGAVNGVAAIIIATGEPIDFQDRSEGNWNNPVHYLDSYGAVDNADFVNSTLNGFVLGPIVDADSGKILVNDQAIVITAEEVLQMAEKATLQTYRDSIESYLEKTGGVYPWLYNYENLDTVDDLTDHYPGGLDFDNNPNNLNNPSDNGRIPSIFGEYFNDTGSQKIESRLAGSFNIDFAGMSLGIGYHTLNFGLGSNQVSIPFETSVLNEVGFENLAELSGNDGRLTASVDAEQNFGPKVLYFSTDHNNSDNWHLCPNGASDISDCWRDADGNPNPGVAHLAKASILRLILSLKIPAGDLKIDSYLANNPDKSTIVITPATASSHAGIEAIYNLVEVEMLPSTNWPINLLSDHLTVDYAVDYHYHEDENDGSHGAFDPANYDIGRFDASDLQNNSSLNIGMAYYPELPGWVRDNQWHHKIKMAYASSYRPGLSVACATGPAGDCLKISDIASEPTNLVSLLVLGIGPVQPDDQVDLSAVFDPENYDSDTDYLTRSGDADGDDQILIIEEQ